MCKFSSKSGGVPFQPLGDLTWNDPARKKRCNARLYVRRLRHGDTLCPAMHSKLIVQQILFMYSTTRTENVFIYFICLPLLPYLIIYTIIYTI